MKSAKFLKLLCLGLMLLSNSVVAQDAYWERANGPYGGYVTALGVNSQGDIFAGTFAGGAYRSSNDAESWTRLNLPDSTLYALALAFNGNDDVFAATYRGIYRSLDNGDNWTAVNSGTGNAEALSLAINSNGDREIVTLVDQPVTAGTHKVVFEASSLPGGVYFYQIQAGDFVETRKLTLLK